jgi:hypothetical protein
MAFKSDFAILGRPATDLRGKTFGRLLVKEKEKARPEGGNLKWICVCSCGTESRVYGHSLMGGRTQSCGCLHREKMKTQFRTHGKRQTVEYTVWSNMRSRCNDPNLADYGGRGISVCERWSNFNAFYEDMGPRPSPKHSIDRINNDGNYEPSNCRWATLTQQKRNMRRNVVATINGERLHLMDAASRLGLCHSTLTLRIKRGWPIERAFTAPKHTRI